MNDVANIIRGARTRAELSQTELAVRAGTSQPALARYETGAALPTLPTLERLLLGCGRRLHLRTTQGGEPSAAAISVRGQLGAQARTLRKRRRALLNAARRGGVVKIRL